MKHKITLALLGLVLASTAWNSAEARNREDRRQTRQSARIMEGHASGDLTKGEMKRLRKSGKAVRKAERRFENNDGSINAKEAAALEVMQDARSKQIHRLKNNDRVQVQEPAQEPAADAQ